ncbi:MAG: response regulator, partial [Huintestinicola sp.]
EEAMGLAQAANQAKTDFLSAMSHELRTPINSILGFNEMIMQQTNDTEIKKCTDNVQTAGMNLLSIINNILDYTEIEGGRLKITNNPYSTRSMLRDVLAYAEYGTDKSLLELRTNIDENIPSELSGDITRIIQVFDNVISNAVKYTYRGYVEIAVKWTPDNDGSAGVISARITDSGVGIKKEDLARLSESFIRLDIKKNQNIQGVGLGLSIVTKLLSLMDGTISIESEYEKGTTVSFELRQTVINPAPAGKISPLGSGEIIKDDSYKFYIPEARILTVDDNGMNRELFKGLLKDSGAYIDAVSGGRDAISLLEKNSYDIIFLDHMMPEMDGIETLRVIKDRALSNSPVVVLTANTVAGAREMYLSEGFDDYLAKPVTGRMLYDVLKRYLPAEMIKEMPQDTPAPREKTSSPRRKRTVMERLGQFLDTATGLTYCCEDEGFYVSMLETYLENTRLEDMKNFYEQRDLDNYRITVHSIKSTSLTIGATELSGEAKGLEMAQKSGDIGYIEENHQRVYEMYAEMLQKIKAVLDDPDDILGGEEREEERVSKILIVDDDPSCLAIAKHTLETKFEVITAASGEEALKILKKNAPELAVLDIYMPEMDGFELMKRIREISDVPVVFLTADSDKSLEERCLDEGAMDFITKPVTSTILINRLSRVIELDELKKRVIQNA